MDIDLINDIKNTKNDEEIKEIIDEIILECLEALEEIDIDTKVLNTLGVESEINNNRCYINQYDVNDDEFNIQSIWTGFIPNNTKIIYGVYIDKNRDVSNKGQYYYLDDNSYLYEFSKYIKDKEIETEEDFISYVYDFLEEYLGNFINPKERQDIHKLLYKNDDYYFKPTKEHSNKDFVGTGGAMCTEYSTLAQNIFTIYGFDMMYMMDDKHAYNLISIRDKVHILDLSMNVVVLDLDGNVIGDMPFLEEIEDFDSNYLNRVVYGKEKFIVNDYYDIYMNEKLFKVTVKDTREYGVWGTREDLLGNEENNNERIIRSYK